MSREKQIEEAALAFEENDYWEHSLDSDMRKAFEAGARWADSARALSEEERERLDLIKEQVKTFAIKRGVYDVVNGHLEWLISIVERLSGGLR